MPQIADRKALQVRAHELVPGLELVLVEVRSGETTERSRCSVEKVEGDEVFFNHGGTMTLAQLTDNHAYYYVPATRWQCAVTA